MADETFHILLSEGNVRNFHFYLTNCARAFPSDAIGGGNKAAAGVPSGVTFTPGQRVQTDVAGDKMILRCRSAIKGFFESAGAHAGDTVVLTKTGRREFEARLMKAR